MNTQTYSFKILLAIDIFVASLIWRDADVTISSYTGLALRRATPPLWARCIAAILPKGHCDAAIAYDVVRAKAALEKLGG